MSDEFDFSGSYGSEASKAGGSRKGGNFNKTGWLTLKGKPEEVASGLNVAIVRFLTDHVSCESNPVPWITVDMHTMVPTKNQPKDWPEGAKWPQSMGAVCRNDKVFRARYGDCYIHTLKRGDGKPYSSPSKTWALAVLREEVIGTQDMATRGDISDAEVGKVIGVRDKTKQVQKIGEDGKPIEGGTVNVPEIVIVQQAWKNFWSNMQGCASRFGTVLDRDYHITRVGHDESTTYQIVPLDPIIMQNGSKYDLRDVALMKSKYPDLPDLRDIVSAQADDDYYSLFFDPSKEAPARKQKDGQSSSSGGGSGPSAPAPAAEPDSDKMAALKARIGGYDPNAAPAEAPSAAPVGASAPAGGGMRDFS